MIGFWTPHVSGVSEDGDLYVPFNAKTMVQRLRGYYIPGTPWVMHMPLGSANGIFNLDSDLRLAVQKPHRVSHLRQFIHILNDHQFEAQVYLGAIDPEASPLIYESDPATIAAKVIALVRDASTVYFDRLAKHYHLDASEAQRDWQDELITHLQNGGLEVGGESHERGPFAERKDLAHMPMESAYVHNIDRYRNDFTKPRVILIRGGNPWKIVRQVPRGHIPAIYPWTIHKLPQ